VISFPPFLLDPVNEQLWRGKRLVALKPKTFAVLRHLVERPQRLVTKEDLLDALWGDVQVGEAVLKTHLREIRQALGDNVRAPRFIETVHRRGYRFIAGVQQASGPAPDHSAPRASSATPGVVGRHVELARLHDCLERAQHGQRQIVFVTGEPGIGKTSLVRAFLQGLGGRGDLRLASGQCIEPYGAGEPYLPILESMSRLCRAPGGAHVVDVLTRHAPSWLAQMPGLFATADGVARQPLAPGATPQRMLREMAEALETLGSERPLMLWLEDLHWADYSTLDLIAYVARRSGAARLMLLATYRPVQSGSGTHPLGAVEEDLLLHGQCELLSLAYLDEHAVAEYLDGRWPRHGFPPALATLLHQRTEGNPLFMVSLVDSLVERGVVGQVDGRWQLTVRLDAVTVGVPENLARMIAGELDRRDDLERSVLEAASVAGVEFATLAVAAALNEDAIRVEDVCTRLARRGQFVKAEGPWQWPDGTLTQRCGFIHGLYQAITYEGIGVARRAQWHQRIGERLEAAHGERVGAIATELAMHFERGRDVKRAVRYLRLAGENALLRSAYREAVAHLTRALTLLRDLPESRASLGEALEIHLALSPALIALNGAGSKEVEASYLAARDVVDRLGDESRRFAVQWGLWFVNYSRGHHAAAREAGEQLLAAAERRDDPEQLLEAHHTLWPTLSAMGQPGVALGYIERGLTLFERERHATRSVLYGGHDPDVCCRYYLGLTRWLLGYPDGALDALQDALRLVEVRRHPLTTVNALWFKAWVHHQRGERHASAAIAGDVIAMSSQYGFTGWPDAALPLTDSQTGRHLDAPALAELKSRLVSAWTGGAVWRQVFCLCRLAEIHAEAGRVGEALGALRSIPPEARGAFYAPEIHRIEGEVLLRRTPTAAAEAEGHFRTAIDLARVRAEKSLELRAATSLARLWLRRNRHGEARELLADVLGWFTEGFATADLRAARTLLDEIA
jgi:DNA-binding winged helix-turn-helix (wHTH) protein/tetratricopeptide (TPR) repeat protein